MEEEKRAAADLYTLLLYLIIPYTLYLIHYTLQKMEEEKRAAADLYTLLLYLIIPYTLYLTENGRGEEGSS